MKLLAHIASHFLASAYISRFVPRIALRINYITFWKRNLAVFSYGRPVRFEMAAMEGDRDAFTHGPLSQDKLDLG